MLPANAYLRRALRILAAVGIVCVILLVEFHYHLRLRNTTITYTLLLAILVFALRWDRAETIAASIVAALGLPLFLSGAPLYAESG